MSQNQVNTYPSMVPKNKKVLIECHDESEMVNFLQNKTSGYAYIFSLTKDDRNKFYKNLL